MSLDSVELILSWEESMGVEISDAEAETLSTARTAIDLIARKLDAADTPGSCCLTLRAFNKLRHAIITTSGLPRRQIRPDTRLPDLFPKASRRAAWDAIRTASGISKLPWPGDGCWLSQPAILEYTVLWTVAHAARSLKPPDAPWSRDEIRMAVRAAISDTSGLKDFSDDDDIVHDLGID
jgi:hypothetical protein